VIAVKEILPGTGRWQAKPDGGVEAPDPTTAFGDEKGRLSPTSVATPGGRGNLLIPPRSGEDL